MGFFETTRKLSIAEQTLAKSVFKTFLPYTKILIGDHTGLGGAPWTEQYAGTFTLHMGEVAYADCTSSRWTTGVGTIRNTFIHELTHVWQAQKGGRFYLPLMRHPFCRYRYELEPGWAFSRYGLEQQAEIVRHRFLADRGEQVPIVPPASLLPFA